MIFLYRIERGRASKSYGIEVARLAGLPPAVLERAREVLARLERYELDVFADDSAAPSNNQSPDAPPPPKSTDDGADALERAAGRARRRALAAQATLFDSINQSLLDEIRGVDVETLPAEEARRILLNIRGRIV